MDVIINDIRDWGNPDIYSNLYYIKKNEICDVIEMLNNNFKEDYYDNMTDFMAGLIKHYKFKNIMGAMYYYEKAAHNGNVDAMMKLIDIYNYIQNDESKIIYWCIEAIKAGKTLFDVDVLDYKIKYNEYMVICENNIDSMIFLQNIYRLMNDDKNYEKYTKMIQNSSNLKRKYEDENTYNSKKNKY